MSHPGHGAGLDHTITMSLQVGLVKNREIGFNPASPKMRLHSWRIPLPAAPLRSTPPAPEPVPFRYLIDVRIGAERAVGYEIAADEFLVGGSETCDLRLPGQHLPAVICRIARTDDDLVLRLVDKAFPVFLNGTTITGTAPHRLEHGDRLAVGPADVTLARVGVTLHPRYAAFVPAQPEPAEPGPVSTAAAASTSTLADDLARQARELEEDRVLWYRRRTELEQECEQLREEAKRLAAIPSPDEAGLTDREAELTRRQHELQQFHEELVELRQKLVEQYREHREQLAQREEVVRNATEQLTQRQNHFDSDMSRQRLEFEETTGRFADERESTLNEREAELAHREEQLRLYREQYAADLVRLDRWQGTLEEKQRHLDRRAGEVDDRFEQLTRDSVELEEQVRLANAEQDQLQAESLRLETLRRDLETEAARQAERSAQLEAQQAMLAVLRAGLDRQQHDARREAGRLANDRARVDQAASEIDERLREAERLRAELTTSRDDQAQQQALLEERNALLESTLHEIQEQKAALAAEQTRLQTHEADLDRRTAEIAEQAAILKARVSQVMELQERLEADRTAVRTRETSLAESDSARQIFQEQLRRRAEELAARTRHLDDSARLLAEEKAAIDELRAGIDTHRQEFDRHTHVLAEREAAVNHREARLREGGQTVAAARKELAASRRAWETERAALLAADAEAKKELAALQAQVSTEFAALARSAPELETQAQATLERLHAAREALRAHVGELHTFAGSTRGDLETMRIELRAESDRLHSREQALEQGRAEHRLAVAEFRQQMLDWQSRIGELKQTLARSESRIEARESEVQTATQRIDATSEDLLRQAAELREERERIIERRTEVERHLAEMREWYRRKLRELANDRQSKVVAPAPRLEMNELDPGDKQLGELLQSLELVDADTLNALWSDAQRQRRTLRQVLLASGTITLYQLALIEADNVDALMLGRLRVLDRLRVTAHEAVYRVFDPTRAESSDKGIVVLRHLAESEMDDAVRPDEFQQRFASACSAANPHLAATYDVLEIQGRPAVIQEWIEGVPSSDWPTDTTNPGVWLRVMQQAAAAVDAAHAMGVVHGRLNADAFRMTAEHGLKVIGFGEPPWLQGGSSTGHEPTPADDLRELGHLAFQWTQRPPVPGKRRTRAKAFPESLLAVIRRLEAESEPVMEDTAGGPMPYHSASELVADLTRLAKLFPCTPEAWKQFLQGVFAEDEESSQAA